MNDKSQLIKQIVAKIDTEKIANYPEHPQSKTLRQIINYSQRIKNSNNDEEIFKLAVNIAYFLDTIVNISKYVKDEEEKKYWLELSEKLFMTTKGPK
jgi:hypothetical protein